MAVHGVFFPNIARLELDGGFNRWSKMAKAAAAIASMLHCCPVLCDLNLNLISTVSPDYFKNSKQVQHFFQRKSQLDFDRSIDDFMRNSISKRGDHRHNGDEVSGFIPGLTACSFTCLQNNLRRVSLQFRLDENSENFGVRLVKFFAENAMVLEELRVLTVETET